MTSRPITVRKFRLITPVLALVAALLAGSPIEVAASPGSGSVSDVAAIGSAQWSPGQPVYDVGKESNVPIEMSDGVTLKADVYRPLDRASGKAARGRFPVIVTLTPYRKALESTYALPALVERGYLHVIVDVRGTGTSGGRFGFFNEREQRDGPEVVRWAARLDGANGVVGMYGGSYLGVNQLHTAGRVGKNSPLKAIMPVVAAHDLYRDFGAPGGMTADFFIAAWFGVLRPTYDTVVPPEDAADDPRHATRAWVRRLGNIPGTNVPPLLDVTTGSGTRYDGPFYRLRNPAEYLDRIVDNKVATLLVGGWSDVFQRGEMLNYSGLQNASAGRPVDSPMNARQPVSDRFQLVQGPWFHGVPGTKNERWMLALRWFDTWLKGKDTGMRGTRTPAHLFEVGSNRWVDVAQWPIPSADVETYFLDGTSSGTAASRNDGTLSTRRPSAPSGEDVQPFSQIPELCTRLTEQYSAGQGQRYAWRAGQDYSVVNPCVTDNRGVQASALTYTSRPFTRATSIAGPITATLYAQANRPDSSTIITVDDVAPDGQSRPLTGGMQMGSFRATDPARAWTHRGKLVRPYHPFTRDSKRSMATGTVERLDVEIYPVLARLKRGHRLRITITSNLAPILMPPEQADLAGGITRYQRNSAHASHINIPMIPSEQLPTSSTKWGSCAGAC